MKELDSWRARLDRAGREADIVWLVKDYVATWLPQEIAELPPECRPGRFADAEDISAFALQLVRSEVESDHETPSRLHHMAAFFSHAAMRLSQIFGSTTADQRQKAYPSNTV